MEQKLRSLSQTNLGGIPPLREMSSSVGLPQAKHESIPPFETQAKAVPPVETRPSANQKSRFLSWFHELTGGDWGTNPDEYDPVYLRRMIDKVSALYGPGRYFDLKASGFQHVPNEPCLVVSNHSGGAAAPDVWGFMLAWHQHFQTQRALHALAHEMILSIKATGVPFGKLGALRADPSMALRVLSEWKRDIFVMPGGDVEVFRPYKERYQVCFAGRKGYIRLALKTGVPIVPVANAGPHETLMVLTDGKPIARALKLDRLFRLNVFPIHLSFPWGLAIGPFPHIPPPMVMRYRVGSPVPPPAILPPDTEPSEALVDEYDRRVQQAIQVLLSELEEEATPPYQHAVKQAKRVGRGVLKRFATYRPFRR
jgi:1-acyl-sn-glycerol-3-phosphate acyltransferase